MSDFRRTQTTGIYDAFYWIGIALTLSCFALVLAGNTTLLWRFEHTGFPLSWACGALAIVSFLAAEVCPSPTSATPEFGEEQVPSTELEAVGL
jgi:hypothetical protein